MDVADLFRQHFRREVRQGHRVLGRRGVAAAHGSSAAIARFAAVVVYNRPPAE
jgi:hypothetical protein